jgi:transcriptional regulator with XRE-family HTH domain
MRSKLIEARESRGWTQEAAAKHLGIDRATLQRWEYGQSKPRGYSKKKLCEVYEADAYALGLDSSGATDCESVAPPGQNFLETKLLTHILQWPRNCLNYSELRGKLRRETEASMTNELNRRRALELMATLPISVFGLSPFKAVATVAAEEVLPWIAGGITGCWGLGRGSDLTLASSIVSSYIPTLTVLSSQSRYRKPAANLAAQAWLLKATLGWHCETLNAALQYALEAEKYSKMAEDYTLQVDALHRLGMVFYYSKRYDQALTKLEEAKEIVEHQSVPRTIVRHSYLYLATYQAHTGKIIDAKKSMKNAHKLFGASPSADPLVDMLGYESGSDFLRWEGVALSDLGDHGAALDSYGQIIDQRIPVFERVRVELLCNQLNSKLKTKDRDLAECIALWTDAITGAVELQSEQRFNEALALYETMECIWPGETKITELRHHVAHW